MTEADRARIIELANVLRGIRKELDDGSIGEGFLDRRGALRVAKEGLERERESITQRLRIEQPPGSKVVLCLHPTGHHSVLAAPPDARAKPTLLFTNRPK